MCVLVGGDQVSFSSVHLNAPVVVGSVGSSDHTGSLDCVLTLKLPLMRLLVLDLSSPPWPETSSVTTRMDYLLVFIPALFSLIIRVFCFVFEAY